MEQELCNNETKNDTVYPIDRHKDDLSHVLFEYKEYHGAQFFDKDFGKLLALIRLKRGIRQNNLAAYSGVLCSLLSDYENGKLMPTIYSLGKIARGLGKRLIISITDD